MECNDLRIGHNKLDVVMSLGDFGIANCECTYELYYSIGDLQCRLMSCMIYINTRQYEWVHKVSDDKKKTLEDNCIRDYKQNILNEL